MGGPVVDEPTAVADEPDAEDEDPCADGHSWEYLYSVFKCNNCDKYEED